MVDEKSSLTKTHGKTKQILKNSKYGAMDDKNDFLVESKQKYRKLRFLKKLLTWRSVKKTKEELLEEGPAGEEKQVTLVTYAFCFIMMMAGLSVKID